MSQYSSSCMLALSLLRVVNPVGSDPSIIRDLENLEESTRKESSEAVLGSVCTGVRVRGSNQCVMLTAIFSASEFGCSRDARS